MLWEPSGCCCFSRRTGSLILGTILLVTASLNILGLLKTFLTNDLNQIIKEVCTEGEKIENCEEFTRKVVIGTASVYFIVSLVQLIFSILLIYGIMKSKTRMLIPFMIMYLIHLIIIMAIVMIVMGLLAAEQAWKIFFIVALVGGFWIFLETYFLLVIRAYYLEVRRQKAQEHVLLQEEGFNPTPPIPQDKPILYSALYPNQGSPVQYFDQEKSNLK